MPTPACPPASIAGSIAEGIIGGCRRLALGASSAAARKCPLQACNAERCCPAQVELESGCGPDHTAQGLGLISSLSRGYQGISAHCS